MSQPAVRATLPGQEYVVKLRSRGFLPSSDGTCKSPRCTDPVGDGGRFCSTHEDLFGRLGAELYGSEMSERNRAAAKRRKEEEEALGLGDSEAES